jgi:adenylylsulfate kinase-like enzyme
MARELFPEGEFIEVHVATPLSVCETRDAKGLYRRARAGEIKNFTGIDSAYEEPERPEIRVDTSEESVEAAVNIIVSELELRNYL